MKENTTIFVVMTGDTPERAFSSEELADMFITTHERDYNTYIQPLELDQADRYFDPEQYEKEENTAKNAFSAYDIQKQDSGKVQPITSYGECTHPNRKCERRKDGKCPDAQMAIQFCRNCSDEDLQKADEFAKALPHAFKQIAEEKERVNHPKHYQHPSGVECITIARHHDFNIGNALKYLFRAGLKQEQGISPLDKQIEDLQKAAFYIQDEIKFLQTKQQEQ